MIRTATPRVAASRIALATTAAVSGARWKSYCATSSDRRASSSQPAIASAISSGCCPPSVRVRTVSFVDELAAAEIGATFNFYREGPRAGLLRRRLADYLEAREEARFLLVGEAPGYRGARVSGIPFTSERQLFGSGPAETTATIVRRVLEELGLEEQTLCWNAVPTHPGTETTNRRPTRAETEAGRPFFERLAHGRRVIAVGRIAAAATGAEYIRHPSHGGAEAFREGLLALAPGGRPVRRFHAKDLERKTRRDRAPLVRR
jgi:uracil DNA glycosylase superfamily protein